MKRIAFLLLPPTLLLCACSADKPLDAGAPANPPGVVASIGATLPPGVGGPSPAGLPAASAPVPEDIARVRSEWANRDDLFERCEIGPFEEAERAFEAQDWKGLLAIAQPWIERCPVDIDPRFFAMVALDELGRKNESQEQRRWVVGLVDSVLSSGDGKSPGTAYLAFTIAEEYAVLRIFGYVRDSQALLENGIDCLGVHHARTKQEMTVYFNPAPHWRGLMQREG